MNEFSPTQSTFLQIISDFLNGRQSKPFDADTDWTALKTLADNHQLTSIFHYQCKDFCGSLLQSSYSHTIFAYANRKRIINEMTEKFKSAGVNYFLIKGPVVAEYYPVPALRTMGDVDIVVDDREKAHKILLSLGFQGEVGNLEREWSYFKQGFELELHDRLVYDEAINEDKATSFFNSHESYIHENKLDDSFHFLFLLNHLRKHLMNSGVGFRQFIDVAVMEKNCNNLDWSWITQKLVEINLHDFFKTVNTMMGRWFGVELPDKVAEAIGAIDATVTTDIIGTTTISDEFFYEATQMVFNNGVFGFNNEENRDYLAANEARGNNHKAATIKRLIRRIFPSYRTLAASPNFTFLRGKSYLLPIAWLYGFWRHIKSGRKNAGKSFVSKDYVEKREMYFRGWGLRE